MSKVQKNGVEWVVFGVGLLLVLGTLGYLAYEGATMGDAPPSIEVRLGTPEQSTHNYIVPVTVINHGDRTAEGVTVEVSMKSGNNEEERGEIVIAFLPRKARREGWVTFRQNPSGAELKARVLGYENP
jgi:uncharacterized protein (TIGR02588 family)